MTNKEYALKYASIGWQVFPVWWVKDGQCACNDKDCQSPGKHPLTSHGLTDASDDEVTISKWWDRHPNANIGVATGPESGLVVIDVDDPAMLSEIDVPKTVTQKTGSGGFHFLFRHPGTYVKSITGVMPKVDSRGDGGYIIVPPSNHISGAYKWLEDPFDGCEIEAAPEWWIEAVANTKKERKKRAEESEPEVILEGGRNQAVFDYGVMLWKQVPMTENVLFSALVGYNNGACKPPLEDSEVSMIAHSIVKYEGMTKAEWEEHQKYLKIAESWADGLANSHQKKIAESLITNVTKEAGPPPEFMPETGLIKDIAEFIMRQSERPLPLLAISAATTLVGVLSGGKFETYSGLGPNIMMVCLAESGSGKQKPKSVINNILHTLNLFDYSGADDIASAPGLIAELSDHPNKIFFLDEFGYALQSITNKNSASSKREIMSTMMKLYSSYNTTYNGTAYADKKNRPKVIINSPCLVIMATSTHQSFYDALSIEHGSDGFISRLMVVPCGEEREDRVKIKYDRKIPGNIKAKLMELSGVQLANGEKVVVFMPEDIEDAFISFDNSMTKLMGEHKDLKEQARSIYSRVAENANKLAMIYAISVDIANPVIDHKAFLWGREIALWCANHIMEKLSENVASNETERTNKKMIALVKDAGRRGMTRREILRSFLGMKAYERDEMLEATIKLGFMFEHNGRVFHSKFKDILEEEVK